MQLFLEEHGFFLAVLSVFLEQLGLPIITLPIVAGISAMYSARLPLEGVLVASITLSAVLANGIWYFLGYFSENWVLRQVCHLTLSPNMFLRKARRFIERWGPLSLLLVKFVPALSVVVSALAGILRMPVSLFFLFDTLGAFVWSAAAIGTGVLFHDQFSFLFGTLAQKRSLALGIFVGFLLIVVLWRIIRRGVANRSLRLASIEAPMLKELLESAHPPMVIDIRSEAERRQDSRRIPGAISLDAEQWDRESLHFPKNRMIVVYCACPNEADSVRCARMALNLGVKNIHPLKGGWKNWLQTGMPLEKGKGA
ncbi:MAG: rhodanese-like domain-containing protein [Nitrospirota bacterium]|nr:rhodanese-like domain-containing protein [Nitrospirota bacterium]